MLKFPKALTLIELLVVIVIVMVLTGLTLTGVQAIRNQMQASVCQNNLRQVGIGLASFESSHGYLPTGWPDNYSTFVALLPYMEHQALYDKLDLSLSYAHPVNIFAHDQRPSFLHCPLNNSMPNFGWETSYLICGGTTWLLGNGLGVFDLEDSGRTMLSEIADGLSNTIAVSEFARGTSSNRVRQISANGVRLSVEVFDRLLDEAVPYEDDDQIGELWIVAGYRNTAYRHYAIPGSKSGAIVDQGRFHSAYTPSSNHGGYIHFLRADGSVSSASYAVDRNLWLQLGHRSDGGLDFLKTYR